MNGYMGVLAASLWAAAVCHGQPLRVSGRIVDRDGTAVRNAVLTLSGSGEVKAKTKPNQNGRFLFPSAEPGAYELVCEAPGFARFSVPVKGTYGDSVDVGRLILDRQRLPLPLASELIESASVAENDRVQILLGDGRRIEMEPEPEQTGCRDVAVSPDRNAAGWLVEQPSGSTSYSVPFTLVVFRPGKPLQHFGSGMMLYDWSFVGDGNQVEFSSGPLHGPGVEHPTHEIWDIRTHRKIKQWVD